MGELVTFYARPPKTESIEIRPTVADATTMVTLTGLTANEKFALLGPAGVSDAPGVVGIDVSKDVPGDTIHVYCVGENAEAALQAWRTSHSQRIEAARAQTEKDLRESVMRRGRSTLASL